MFYSHQLLARKAPMGQIWMAATLHAKINRRKLNKLNLVKICEEILNPAVPMALRLSGILMGGVVIVYELKVKILYDDVQRLLVEINEAWKVNSVTDRNILPKGKSHAKFEDVTLPDHHEEMEVGVGEQSNYKHFSMRLDEVDIPDINGPERDDHSKHQVDAANITLVDPFDSYQMDADLYNHFERFDIEGDEGTQLNISPQEHFQVPVTEGTQLNISPQEHFQVPVTPVSSPPPREEPQPATGIQEQHPEPHGTEDAFQPHQNEQRRGPAKRKPRKQEQMCFVMDYEQTIIPGHTYQSWLQNPSDIISTRGKRKSVNLRSSMKTTGHLDIPLVARCGLSGHGNREVHYPPPLMEQWLRSTQLQTANASISGRTATQLPEPFFSSPSSRTHDQIPMEFPLEDHPSGDGFQPFEVPMEDPIVNLNNIKVPRDVFAEKLTPNHINNEFSWKASTGTPGINLVDFEMPVNEGNLLFTPGNSGNNAGTSSASGHGFQIHVQELELRSGRSSKKRPYSSSHGQSNLESVAEEPSVPFEQGFKLPGVYENGSALDNELLVETGPTPSQHPIVNQPIDKVTDSIQKNLKTHFDMPGVPNAESLNHLAFGMKRSKAAQLFYQTCVLATRDFVRVEQTTAYGDILISKGSKM